MDLNDFNNESSIGQTIPKKKKTLFILGHYNVELSKYEKHPPTHEFLGSLA